MHLICVFAPPVEALTAPLTFLLFPLPVLPADIRTFDFTVAYTGVTADATFSGLLPSVDW